MNHKEIKGNKRYTWEKLYRDARHKLYSIVSFVVQKYTNNNVRKEDTEVTE